MQIPILHDSNTTAETTSDSLFHGELSCRQFKRGYRFSIDAVLAAHFACPERGEAVLDLGAGCGIIGLIMMYRYGERISSLQALEYQPQLCWLIEENFRHNGLDEKCSCIQGDVRNIHQAVGPESFSMVVCNPPYYEPGTGRKNQVEECSIARHQIVANLDDFTSAAAKAVKNRGTVIFIYPADQLTRLCNSLNRVRLEIKELRCVYSSPDCQEKATLVLVKCVKNGGKGVAVALPLYIYEKKNGKYSEEVQKYYES